jgi:hypothetical protein
MVFFAQDGHFDWDDVISVSIGRFYLLWVLHNLDDYLCVG